MKNIRIAYEERTIVITKKFAKEASKYGSDEYKILKKIREDNPGYKVVVRETSKTTSSINRVTLAAMENYISKHDETGEIMKKFLAYKNEEAGENLKKTSFFKIKKWFFETYHELKNLA